MPINPAATAAPPQILVVDDEPDMQALIRQKFRRAIRKDELRFFFAGNGVEALQVLAAEPGISMVISDINMPEMDGLTLLGQLKTLNPNIRSVIVSAYGDLDNIRQAMNRGAYDFLTKPIDFDDFQLTLEKTLAHLAEIRSALNDRDRLVSLNHELGIARQIQQDALPKDFPDKPDYQIFGSMDPARSVGGDFFDFFALPGNRVGCVVGDVSGKGVPAALFMMVCQALVRSCAEEAVTPAELLAHLNRQLLQNNPAMMFVTLFYGIFEPASGRLVYAQGGHEPAYLLRRGDQPLSLPQGPGAALGVIEGNSFCDQEIQLQPGAAVCVYTDGVTDALDEAGERFGRQRLVTTLQQQDSASAQHINRNVVARVNEHAANTAQEDDLTCLVLKRLGGAG